jgi:transposase-like protein
MKDSDNEQDTYDKNNNDKIVEAAKKMLDGYLDANKSIRPSTLFNLSKIKEETNKPKQDSPDAAFAIIQNHLGNAESSETLRIERWQDQVRCPYCNSNDIKRLSVVDQKSEDIYTYLCLACNSTFNDDSETEFEGPTPPLNTWMMCWYLLGCTNSLQYIASKLGLSVSAVEVMVRHMQKMFNAQQPMKNFLSFEEWSAQHGTHYQKVLEKALDKIAERMRGYSVGQEQDTAEVRKQRTRAEKDAGANKPFAPRPKF